jgi:hypothetical protein
LRDAFLRMLGESNRCVPPFGTGKGIVTESSRLKLLCHKGCDDVTVVTIFSLLLWCYHMLSSHIYILLTPIVKENIVTSSLNAFLKIQSFIYQRLEAPKTCDDIEKIPSPNRHKTTISSHFWDWRPSCGPA